ncbi:hypothetical protein DFH07DRAFT_959600 [Mycena maculata]|uniref:Uncharacterized protein n=1 Tax=Mycena maculata TaxID=230809 RepID=A0AAD7J1C3_9AGAR|nr:hypothetical protein DFH07DRAFT_959600 [Mycena maculata]
MTKKRGNTCDFHGQRAEYLTAFYPTYSDTSKRGKTREIWTKFFLGYWAKFPWRLPLNQDPDPLDTTDYSALPRDVEEEMSKERTIAAMEKKIKGWFSRQGKSAGIKSNPWATWLARFRTPAGSPPKRLADYQFYMVIPEIKEKVSAEYEK